MSSTLNPVAVTSIRLDIAEMIKKERDMWLNKGVPSSEAINSIATAFGKTPAFVYSQLSVMELPSEIIGMMRSKPITIGFAMKVWRDTNGDAAKTKEILLTALANAESAGAKKAMPKYLN